MGTSCTDRTHLLIWYQLRIRVPTVRSFNQKVGAIFLPSNRADPRTLAKPGEQASTQSSPDQHLLRGLCWWCQPYGWLNQHGIREVARLASDTRFPKGG